MFNIFKKDKKTESGGKQPKALLFQGRGLVDVTNFGATSPKEPLGYMCGGIVSVFSDGRIEIRSDDEHGKALEAFCVSDVLQTNSNIGNFDPAFITAVSLMTEEMKIRITFRDAEEKSKYVQALQICSEARAEAKQAE